MDREEKNFKALELISDIRKFEIGLFWSRSLFFWGFIAIAITAYGAASQLTQTGHAREIQLAIACVGLFVVLFGHWRIAAANTGRRPGKRRPR